jgi:hypothetical protein
VLSANNALLPCLHFLLITLICDQKQDLGAKEREKCGEFLKFWVAVNS